MCRQKTADASAEPDDGGEPQRADGGPDGPAVFADAAREGLAPLYERLPRGPHGLDRGEVLAHQRARLHGALSVAAAESGYRAVTVAGMTRLAGVSRRSFYELFADKDDCLHDTLDTVSRRWVRSAARACSACGESPERRAEALAATLAGLTAAEPEAALLVLARTPGAGPVAVRRRLELAGAYEQLLLGPRGPAPLAPAVARALVGGMFEIATVAAGRGGPAAPEGLAARLCKWLVPVRDPDRARAAALLAASAQARLQALPVSAGRARGGRPPRRGTPCERLHAAALSLTAGEGEPPSGAEIADAAGVSVACFLDLFKDGEACHEAALAAAAEEALAEAGAAASAAGEWPLSVRPVLEALFAHLADRPLHVPALVGWPAAEPRAGGMMLRRLAQLVAGGTAAPGDSGGVLEGIVGAIWHTVAHQAGRDRLDLLPLLGAEVAYVALAPALGARRAAEVAGRELTAAGAGG